MIFAQLLHAFSALSWIEIALLIFVAVFIGVVIWVFGAKRGAFNSAARIPLEDDATISITAAKGRHKGSDHV